MTNEMKKPDICTEFESDFEDVGGLLDTTLPEPVMLEYYRGLKNREIEWNDDIDDHTLEVAHYIRKWNREDYGLEPEKRKPIKIFINSDGGSVDAVMHVVDTILLSKTPVITVGLGRVYSAGGLLLMAGHKRYVFEHTSCLIHDGSSGAFGNIGKVLDNLEFTKELEKRVKKYILDRTKIDSATYDNNYRRDWFMFSEEMINLGIADEIVKDLDIFFEE